ncbi:hypothetical protein NMY22_g16561 [Coprinellus aureogranulatus]|nr:hypothetical protein NMY22_g16561 [Coprinellus aureogranulatus]
MDDSAARQFEAFARNGDTAEKAQIQQRRLSIKRAFNHLKGNHTDREERHYSRASRARAGVASEDVIEFRQDSRIWDLYLEGAEREAKERAEIWRTGLDSLLIFAGLFAGIVSSFVIDARKDIQLQSEQSSLAKIAAIMTPGGEAPSQSIPASAQWTSALWILSLYVTLFGTIMGVLAKSWLTSFMPAASRREAKDACIRYELDKQAHRWYLKEIFTLVPLLVQLAAFLFLTGLVLQVCGDHPITGYLLMASCISGGLIYLAITCLNLIGVRSPFNTPLSELFLRFRYATELPDSDAAPPKADRDINMVLADIVYTHLVKSPNLNHLDAAIAEIPKFKDHWIDFFCKTKTPEIVLDRMRHAVTLRSGTLIRKEEVVSNCMLALLSFVTNYEKWVTADKDVPREPEMWQKYAILNDTLHRSLDDGSILSRWNTLPERLRPLLFLVRLRVIILLQNRTLLHGRVPALSDFDLDELSELPWEMALQEVPPDYRPRFILAMCRGVVGDRPNMRIVSAFTLGILLAKCAFEASDPGRTSDWTGIISITSRQDFTDLASTYLTIIYKEIASHWEATIVGALSQEAAVFSNIEGDSATRWEAKAVLPVPHSDPDTLPEDSPGLCLFRFLLFVLSEMGRRHMALCILATRMLAHCTFPKGGHVDTSSPTHVIDSLPDPMKSLAGIDIQESIVTIKRVALDPVEENQASGLKALFKLASLTDELKVHIQDTLVQGIRDEFKRVHRICEGEKQERIVFNRFGGVSSSLDVISGLCFPDGNICLPAQATNDCSDIGRAALKSFEEAKSLEACIEELLPDLLHLAFVRSEVYDLEVVAVSIGAQDILKQMSDSRFRLTALLRATTRSYLEAEKDNVAQPISIVDGGHPRDRRQSIVDAFRLLRSVIEGRTLCIEVLDS